MEGGESGDRQERKGRGWVGERVGIDRKGSAVGGGESGDRK